jgi:nickel superoxide dismutase
MVKHLHKKTVVAVLIISLFAFGTMVYSHCQIPCGIYGDEDRFDMIAENITTIEKSMKAIKELSDKPKPDMNQIVRWVDNKEKHADDTAHIITYYFLAQRVKPTLLGGEAEKAYVKKLKLLHIMLLGCMEAKQTTDLSHVDGLRSVLADFKAIYFAGHH